MCTQDLNYFNYCTCALRGTLHRCAQYQSTIRGGGAPPHWSIHPTHDGEQQILHTVCGQSTCARSVAYYAEVAAKQTQNVIDAGALAMRGKTDEEKRKERVKKALPKGPVLQGRVFKQVTLTHRPKPKVEQEPKREQPRRAEPKEPKKDEPETPKGKLPPKPTNSPWSLRLPTLPDITMSDITDAFAHILPGNVTNMFSWPTTPHY